MNITYKTSNTCSTQIDFEIEEGIVHNVKFTGGCNGNLKAVSKLVEGSKATDVISKLKGNICGHRSTSCADQLAQALEKALTQAN